MCSLALWVAECVCVCVAAALSPSDRARRPVSSLHVHHRPAHAVRHGSVAPAPVHAGEGTVPSARSHPRGSSVSRCDLCVCSPGVLAELRVDCVNRIMQTITYDPPATAQDNISY